MPRFAVVLICLAARQVQGSADKLHSNPLDDRTPKNHTARTALASLLHAGDPASGFSPSGTGSRSSIGHPQVAKSQPHGPMMKEKWVWEPEPEPWIPSWMSMEEIAEERVTAAQNWKPPPPPPEPWISPLMTEEEKEKELADYKELCEKIANAPAPSWVTDWIERGGMDPPTPPPWVPTWKREPYFDDPRDPGERPPPSPVPPGQRLQKWYKGSAYPPWEPQPAPWIPSWLDEEEQAEQKYEEAIKYRPPEWPEDPWLSPLADDEERERQMMDHRKKVEELGKPPVPKWVTDWLQMGGEVQPTPAPWKPSWQKTDDDPVPAPAPYMRGLPHRNPKWPDWVEEPKPWIPSWLDEDEKIEQQYEAAVKWKPPPTPPPPFVSSHLPQEKQDALHEEHRKYLEDKGPAPIPSWVTQWLKHGEPDPEEEPVPVAADPVSSTWPRAGAAAPAGTAQSTTALFEEGDKIEFKVSGMTRKAGKVVIKFEGPFDFAAEGDVVD